MVNGRLPRLLFLLVLSLFASAPVQSCCSPSVGLLLDRTTATPEINPDCHGCWCATTSSQLRPTPASPTALTALPAAAAPLGAATSPMPAPAAPPAAAAPLSAATSPSPAALTPRVTITLPDQTLPETAQNAKQGGVGSLLDTPDSSLLASDLQESSSETVEVAEVAAIRAPRVRLR